MDRHVPALASSTQQQISYISHHCLYLQSKKANKEEVSETVMEEKSAGTLAAVKEVLGRTGSRGGIVQVRSILLYGQDRGL
jgi:hypothetical protein